MTNGQRKRVKLSKDQRLIQVVNAKNNFYLGLAAIALFHQRATYEPLNNLGVALNGKYGFPFHVVVKLLDDAEAGAVARQEFQRALLRMALKESFEMVRAFAIDHERMPQLEEQPWFHPARLLRNCVSHDFIFRFGGYDRKLLPVEWNVLEITAAMNDTLLTTEHCGPAFVKELVNEFEAFIRNA